MVTKKVRGRKIAVQTDNLGKGEEGRANRGGQGKGKGSRGGGREVCLSTSAPRFAIAGTDNNLARTTETQKHKKTHKITEHNLSDLRKKTQKTR